MRHRLPRTGADLPSAAGFAGQCAAGDALLFMGTGSRGAMRRLAGMTALFYAGPLDASGMNFSATPFMQ